MKSTTFKKFFNEFTHNELALYLLLGVALLNLITYLQYNYLGGVIAPGVNLSLNTLSLKASLIPQMKLNKVSKVIGKNTKNAVQSGFYWGYIGLIKNIVRLIKNQTRKNFKIILTGGLSYLFKDSIDMKNSVDKDLTIKGLMNLLKLNV